MLILAAVVLPVVLLAGVGGGLLLLDEDSNESDRPATAGLTEQADLPRVPFPDPQELGYSHAAAGKPRKMCETIAKTMRTRGYDLEDVEDDLGGAYCNFYTPQLYALKDGAYVLSAGVGVWSGGAVERLKARLQGARDRKQASRKIPGAAFTGPEKFPAGEEGLVYYERVANPKTPQFTGQATAYFHDNDYLVYVEVQGFQRLAGDDAPLERKKAYTEIAGIVHALNGSADPPKPLIDVSDMRIHENLKALKRPRLPELEGRSPQEICAEIAPGLEAIGLELENASHDSGPVSENYTCGSPSLMDVGATPYSLAFFLYIEDIRKDAQTSPTGALGEDVKSAVGNRGDLSGLSGLPFTGPSFVHYEAPMSIADLKGGYVDGDRYVSFLVTGYRAEDGLTPLTEDELTKHLAEFFAALS